MNGVINNRSRWVVFENFEKIKMKLIHEKSDEIKIIISMMLPILPMSKCIKSWVISQITEEDRKDTKIHYNFGLVDRLRVPCLSVTNCYPVCRPLPSNWGPSVVNLYSGKTRNLTRKPKNAKVHFDNVTIYIFRFHHKQFCQR